MRSAALFNAIVVLTGAGISAESGIKTFRDNNGLWENHRFEDVATPEAFATNPALVQRFYNERRKQLLTEATPNQAHRALAKFEKRFSGQFTLITQNVDDLHQRAGSENLLPMHGELLKMRCSATGNVYACHDAIEPHTLCRCCGKPNLLRPHIVWFGEMPFFMEQIHAALQNCDLFVAIGTSAQVYPAAGFVELAKLAGATTVELNLASTTSTALFDESVPGLASKTVPHFFLPGLDQEFS